jgi:hypothetical protein
MGSLNSSHAWMILVYNKVLFFEICGIQHEAVSVVSLTSSSGGYINGRNSANLELLIDKTSSIYLYVKLKCKNTLINHEENNAYA